MNPTPPETALPIADDAKLVHLSAEPAHQLFPTLNRASMMQALVVLFAFVPGIYALQQYVITESDALWGLKCLDMLRSRYDAHLGLVSPRMNANKANAYP